MIQLLVASAWFTWQSVHKEYLNLPDRQMHMQDRLYTKSIKQNTTLRQNNVPLPRQLPCPINWSQ